MCAAGVQRQLSPGRHGSGQAVSSSLEVRYPVVSLKAPVVKVRDSHTGHNQAVLIAVGVYFDTPCTRSVMSLFQVIVRSFITRYGLMVTMCQHGGTQNE